MLDTPKIVHTADKLTAFIHLTIPREEVRNVFGPGVGELLSTLSAQGITPVSTVFTHHLKITQDIFDFELGVQVNAPVVASACVKPGVWPAMKVAQTIYTGPYEGLPDAWGEFMRWIEAEGYMPAPDLWECYVFGPDSSPDPATWRTELNRPLLNPQASEVT